MKKYLLTILICLFASTKMVQAQEEVKVLYMSVVRSTGLEFAVPLYDGDGFHGPVADLAVGRLMVDGRSMLLSRIREIRFSVETEIQDGIEDVEVAPMEDDNNIYSIDGRLVRENAASLSGLPKGMYIMNGKKLCITK